MQMFLVQRLFTVMVLTKHPIHTLWLSLVGYRRQGQACIDVRVVLFTSRYGCKPVSKAVYTIACILSIALILVLSLLAHDSNH
jgi:hypothetical protein